MTGGGHKGIERRPLVIGGIAAALVAVFGAGGYEVVRMFARGHRRPTEYDDLTDLLPDERASLQRVGRAVLMESQLPAWEIAPPLRKHIAGRPLADVLVADAGEGRLVETEGWVLPESLALICALYVEVGG